jgi:hypothetical protein
MDGYLFDQIAKVLATTPSRRRVLRLLLGGGAASLARLAAPSRAGAEECTDPPCKTCGTVQCGQCTVCVGGACENLPELTDCGPDDSLCTSDRCQGGVCVHSALRDGGPCTDDEDACTNDICINGACVHQPVVCSDSNPCHLTFCDPGSGCVTQNQPDDTPCGAGKTCLGGICCMSGAVVCDGACANLKSDRINCGRCGKRCKKGQRCRRGRCG